MIKINRTFPSYVESEVVDTSGITTTYTKEDLLGMVVVWDGGALKPYDASAMSGKSAHGIIVAVDRQVDSTHYQCQILRAGMIETPLQNLKVLDGGDIFSVDSLITGTLDELLPTNMILHSRR